MLRIKWWLRNRWYQFTAFFWHRYSTVKARKLNHEWVDRDMLLYHIMFEVMCQYVEKELGVTSTYNLEEEIDYLNEQNKINGHTKNFETEFIIDRYKREQQFRELYHWWIKFDEEDACNEWMKLNSDNYTLFNMMEQKQSEMLKYRMHQLIDISSGMWS